VRPSSGSDASPMEAEPLPELLPSTEPRITSRDQLIKSQLEPFLVALHNPRHVQGL